MEDEELDIFYTNLARILNTSAKSAKRLVHRYNTGSYKFFKAYFDNFKTATLVTTDVVNSTRDETFHVMPEGKKGNYSVVYTDRALPVVYKVFVIEPYKKKDLTKKEIITKYLKAFFKEIIIQTLLQSDALYGNHVCTVHAIYRRGDHCIMQMEKLDGSLKGIIEVEEGDLLDRSAHILDILVKFLEILIHFHEKYDFQHNDLHTENIMMSSTGPGSGIIKLIDFGNSSVTIEDIDLIDSSDAGIDDLNPIFAYPPTHVTPAVIELFAELEVLDEEESYEIYLSKIIETNRFETAWAYVIRAIGVEVFAKKDEMDVFIQEFNRTLQTAKEEGAVTIETLQGFIEEYVSKFKARAPAIGGRRRRRTYKRHRY
jgi:serine/threonine protein kinase